MNTKKTIQNDDKRRLEDALSEEALRFAQQFDQLNELQTKAIQSVMKCYSEMSNESKTLH